MLVMAMASAMYLAAAQNAAVSSSRTAYADCVRDAAVAVKKDKIPLDQLTPRLREACDAQRTKLKDALVAFDVKNGISRKQAAEDADLQLDDYYLAQEERYAYELEKTPPKANASQSPPAPSPAAAAPQPSS